MAALYPQDVLDDVRDNVLDKTATYRYANSFLLKRLNDGIQEIASRRPSELWAGALTLTAISGETVSGTALYFSSNWRAALAAYVTAAAYRVQGSDREDMQAAAMWAREFEEQMARS